MWTGKGKDTLSWDGTLEMSKGVCERTPTDNSDLANKKYVDDNATSDHSLLSNLSYATAGHTGFEPTISKGNLTAGSTKITIGGTGTGALIGAGASVDVNPANINTSTLNNDAGFITSVSGGDHSTLNNLSYAAAGHTGFEPTLSKGNLTEATSSVLTITGGTGATIGSGTTLQVKQASASQDGYLSQGDWATFNGKENVLTFSSPLSRTGNTASLNFTALYTTTDGRYLRKDTNDNNSTFKLTIGALDVVTDLNITTAGYGYQLGGVDVINDYTQTGGSDCLWIGHQAGLNAVSGTGTPIRTTAVGRLAGYSLTTASDTIFIGYKAGYSATQTSSSVVIGNYAGENLTTGTNHILIGYEAGNSLTTESNNVLIGYEAGKNLTDNANIGIGYRSIYSATSSSYGNVAMGYLALTTLDGGSYNTAISTNAGANLLDGNSNILIGWSAAPNLVSGDNNVIIGPMVGTGAGYTTDTSDRLFIGQGTTDTPLIDGDFANTWLEIYGDMKLNDDYKRYFGTGDDVYFMFNSATSEFELKLDNVGDTDFVIDATAKTIRLKNGAKVWQLGYKAWSEMEPLENWDGVNGPIKAVWINNPAPPPGSMGVASALFSPDVVNSLYGSHKISGQYEENTDIYVAVNWSPIDSNAGNVMWQFEYTAQIPGAAFPVTTTINLTAPSNSTTNILNEDFFVATIPGNLIRYVIDFRISRLGDDDLDTYPSLCVLHGLAFYQINDTIGSRARLTK